MHAGSAGESTVDFRILVALFLRLLVIEQHKFEPITRLKLLRECQSLAQRKAGLLESRRRR